ETGEGHVDLAADLETPRQRRIGPESQRDLADRPQVSRHVFADRPVPARRAPDEDAVLVEERDGRTVDLRLDDVSGVPDLAQDPRVPVLPRPELRGVERVVEGEHRREMLDLRELRR